MKDTINLRRRQIMKQLGLATGGASLLAAQSKFQLMSSALAAPGDYQNLTDSKSLVCVFLFGGCDSFNVLVPYAPAAYQTYANVRQGLAIPRAQLLPINGGSHGFHPSAPGLRTLYNEGRLAWVQNVGALTEPLIPDQYFSHAASIPPELFSHSHQVEFWQTVQRASVTTAQSGWGGQTADLLVNANSNVDAPVSFTMNGSNAWQPGRRTQPFGVRPGLDIPDFEAFDSGTWPDWKPGRRAAWNQILQLTRSGLMEKHAAQLISETQRRSAVIREAIKSGPTINTPYNQDNDLAKQLRSVAEVIAARQALGMKRQLFFVGLGGWDTHGAQLATQSALLTLLSEALLSFYRTTEELGVANSVMTFTLSEFGRTFTSNGDGTDHAWATDVMVLGGAVKGGVRYGDPIAYTDQPSPSPWAESLFGPADVGAGRFIPKYSVDQYGATLGKWMGLTDADLLTVFPNLHSFTPRTLNFTV